MASSQASPAPLGAVIYASPCDDDRERTPDESTAVGIFRITAARDVALSRPLMLYISTGLFFMLLPGTFLGVWNLLGISSHRAWIQAHGHTQMFGGSELSSWESASTLFLSSAARRRDVDLIARGRPEREARAPGKKGGDLRDTRA